MKRRLYSTSIGFGSGPVAIARSAIRPAAERYFSISTGETVSTSPMLSKPSPESSVGKFRSARNSTASRSRIVLVYSARFSRRAVTRPGSGFIAASARANSVSSSLTSVLICSSDGGTDAPSGGISRLLSFERISSHRSRSACERLDRSIERDVEAAGEVAGVVALAAGVVEQRLGRGGEGRCGRRPGDGATRRSRPRRRRRREPVPRRQTWRPAPSARLLRRLDVHRQDQGGGRDADRPRVMLHTAPARPRPGRGAGGADTIAVYTRQDPFLLRRVRDQVAVLALRRRREPRPPVVEHGDGAGVRQLEIAVVGMDGVEHGRQRRRRCVVGHRLEGAVGVDDRMHRRPREVLLDARARVRQRVADFRPDGDDRRRPLGEQLLRRGDVALDRRVRRARRERPGGDDQLLALRGDLRPRAIQVEHPDDAGRRAGEHDGGVAVVLREQQVADEHGALRGADGAGDRAGVGAASRRRPSSRASARAAACRRRRAPPSGMPIMPSVIAPTPPPVPPTGRPRIEAGDDVGELRGCQARPRDAQRDAPRFGLGRQAVQHRHGQHGVDPIAEIAVERDADRWANCPRPCACIQHSQLDVPRTSVLSVRGSQGSR